MQRRPGDSRGDCDDVDYNNIDSDDDDDDDDDDSDSDHHSKSDILGGDYT